MTYRVEVSEPAAQDADAIFEWLSEHSPDGALRWWQTLEQALEKLEHHPTGLPLAPESDGFPERLYQTVFRTRRGRTYRALYIVRHEIVHILRIRGPGQNLVSEADLGLPEQ